MFSSRQRERFLACESRLTRIIFCGLLVLIGFTGPLTLDMYIPALPQIAKGLHAAQDQVQFTMAVFLCSVAITQVVYGPLIDRYGRKSSLLFSLVCSLLGTLLAYFSVNIAMLYAARAVQGVGMAGVATVLIVITRDILHGDSFTQVASVMSVCFGLGPVISPVIGAHVSHWLGWRCVFLVLLVYTVIVVLAAILLIPETACEKRHQKLSLPVYVQRIVRICGHPIFIRNAVAKMVAYAGFMVFYTVSPFILQHHLSVSVIHFGWITLAITSFILLSKLCNALFIGFFGVERLIRYSLILMFFAALSLFCFSLAGCYSLIVVVVPFLMFAFSSGFLFSNTTAAVMVATKKIISGSVASLMNFSTSMFAFIAATVAAHLSIETLLPLGLLLLFMSVIPLGVYIFVPRDPLAIE